MLNEAEAWSEVAVLLESEARESEICYGLCGLVYRLRLNNQISGITNYSMITRIHKYLGRKRWAYGYPCKQDLEARILAALWLAEEARHDISLS